MTSHLIVYTTEVGGALKAMWGSKDQYDQMRRTGYLIEDGAADELTMTEIKFVALAQVRDNYDFALRRPR